MVGPPQKVKEEFMNVSLTPKLEKLVTRKVESGLYQSASEVIREGLRLLDGQDPLREVHLNEVRRKIETGLDQLDRGEGIPGDQAHAQMKRRSAEFRKRER
jgi:antitoxin ParD1/3/4